MQKILLISAVAITLILSYGYWHVSNHGWLYFSLYDTSNKEAYGRIGNAQISLLDSSGKFLAGGKSDKQFGVVRLFHPEVGDCGAVEKKAPFSTQARTAWQECFKKQSTWLMKWIENVHYVDIEFQECDLKRLPIKVSENKDDWWLWWIPHPHIGGKPYTSFNVRLRIDGSTCKVNMN